jgi:hypothetical protein
MNTFTRRSVAMTAPIGFVYAALTMPVLAGVRDYEFQLVQNEVKKATALLWQCGWSINAPARRCRTR